MECTNLILIITCSKTKVKSLKRHLKYEKILVGALPRTQKNGASLPSLQE